MKKTIGILLLMGIVWGMAGMAAAEEAGGFAVYPTAIFPFHERGEGVKGYGNTASDILFASLVANPDLLLVDREEINKTLSEQEIEQILQEGETAQ